MAQSDASKIVDLQKEVAKRKRQFEKACREVASAELRAESAENLLDDKRCIKDVAEKEKEKIVELEKRIEELMGQLNAEKKKGAADRQELHRVSLMLENERKRAKDDRRRSDLMLENERARAEDDKQRFDEASELLAMEKRRAAAKANENQEELELVCARLKEARAKGQARDAQEMALKKENAQLKVEVSALRRRLKVKDSAKTTTQAPLAPSIHSSETVHPNSDDSLDNLSTVPNFTIPIATVKKEEPNESQEVHHDIPISGTGQVDSMVDDLMEREELPEPTSINLKNSPETAEVEKGRGSTKAVSRPLNRKESDEPTKKKSRSEPEQNEGQGPVTLASLLAAEAAAAAATTSAVLPAAAAVAAATTFSGGLICEICDDVQRDNESYLRHLQSQHRELQQKSAADMQQDPPLACNACNDRFWTEEGLDRHTSKALQMCDSQNT